MRRRKPPRVMGPYQERNRWRIVIIERGRRKAVFLPNLEEAQRLKAEVERDLARLSSRKLADVMTEWAQEKLREGCIKPDTVEYYGERLRKFFGSYMERDVAAVTSQRAATLYRVAVERPCPTTARPLSAASQQFSLYLARKLYGWAEAKGYVRCNPFAAIQPVGRVNTGKSQLRIEEARRFIGIAILYYEETEHPLAIGALLGLMMGLRTSEVLDRTVRDVDDGGQLLWIDGGKTKNARRHLEVPEVLRPYLVKLAKGKRPDELLFGCGRNGKPRRRPTMWAFVQRLCARARVPHVCTHSLRGLFATLAVQSGAVTHAVAASLGHGSFAMTQRHYAQPSAVANAATARFRGMLEASSPPTEPALPPSVATQLAQLDPTTLAMLIRVAKSLTEGDKSAA